MKFIRNIFMAALVATPLFAQNAPETWTVDKAHSTATFKVRHMMANTVGQFRDFDANINIDRATPAKSSVEFTIQAKSIDTGNTNRDEHLRGADFFDVAKYPTITFKSTSIAPKSANEFHVTGDLTMHGVTKRVTLPVQFLGFGKTARGEKAGFEIETTVNRKDFGVIWNKTLDEGGLLLGEDVKVTINIEADRKVAAAAPAASK
ncbi:MAG TPA: YceI family protein [Thermoanaerobaculia bacterium]|nr:YceI family protein [Thermoanaerobaculia bacterium]